MRIWNWFKGEEYPSDFKNEEKFLFIELDEEFIIENELPDQCIPVRAKVIENDFNRGVNKIYLLADECQLFCKTHPEYMSDLKEMLSRLSLLAGVSAAYDKDFESSERYLAQVYVLNPWDIEVLGNFAGAKFNNKKYDDALEIYEEIIEKLEYGNRGFIPEVWNNTVEIYIMFEMYTEAADLMESAITIAPEYFTEDAKDLIEELRSKLTKPQMDEYPTIEIKMDDSYEAAKVHEMILIQGGEFLMEDEDENQIHEVILSDYYISKYPVTFEEYDKYCEETGKYKPNDEGWGRGKRPVINVTWEDAEKYCIWLARKTRRYYRLPTEAEWEFAARGGGSASSESKKYSGSDDIEEVAWYKDNSEGETKPVGKKKMNELGIYDMNGNVWEWCYDWHGKYPNERIKNPDGPSNGIAKILRGGSVKVIAANCLNTCRFMLNPETTANHIGFRVVEKITTKEDLGIT